MSGCDDCRARNLSHVSPVYKRALWIVVLLNISMGLVEMVGGFVASSESLKADSLDFLGDGLITFIGLLSTGWRAQSRSRTALAQGCFLGVLGIGILAGASYRFFAYELPEAEIMGGIGIVALAANVTAAFVMRPHKEGDASTRAIWLFSRNDALNNVAVLIAAGLVAWTKTAWPDLVVATVIAGIFLRSSYSIINDARQELAEH